MNYYIDITNSGTYTLRNYAVLPKSYLYARLTGTAANVLHSAATVCRFHIAMQHSYPPHISLIYSAGFGIPRFLEFCLFEAGDTVVQYHLYDTNCPSLKIGIYCT